MLPHSHTTTRSHLRTKGAQVAAASQQRTGGMLSPSRRPPPHRLSQIFATRLAMPQRRHTTLLAGDQPSCTSILRSLRSLTRSICAPAKCSSISNRICCLADGETPYIAKISSTPRRRFRSSRLARRTRKLARCGLGGTDGETGQKHHSGRFRNKLHHLPLRHRSKRVSLGRSRITVAVPMDRRIYLLVMPHARRECLSVERRKLERVTRHPGQARVLAERTSPSVRL